MNIPTPSPKEIQHYLKKWDSLDSYVSQESSLKKLFSKTYPQNTELDDVLIKVCALNDFYSTNIFSPFAVAKHIVALNIDQNLSEDNLETVNKIAYVEVKDGIFKNFYSFATKYCSHHKPTVYPIYDSYLKKILMYFKKKDKFCTFKSADLKTYSEFKNILLKFREFYGLESFDLKQIDKYLWQLGKEYFSRKY